MLRNAPGRLSCCLLDTHSSHWCAWESLSIFVGAQVYLLDVLGSGFPALTQDFVVQEHSEMLYVLFGFIILLMRFSQRRG